MTIDKQTLDSLTEQAKSSPRLRMNLNFHESLDEKCHRFLNAVEPGTVVPIHRHPTKDETFARSGDGSLIRFVRKGSGDRILTMYEVKIRNQEGQEL